MRELTCDDPYSLDTLYAGSLRLMPDGSYAQQVVYVTAGGDCENPDLANVLLSGGSFPDINQVWQISGENAGRNTYEAIVLGAPAYMYFDSGFWVIYALDPNNPGGPGFAVIYTSSSDVDYPWLATWEGVSVDAGAVPTFTCSQP